MYRRLLTAAGERSRHDPALTGTGQKAGCLKPTTTIALGGPPCSWGPGAQLHALVSPSATEIRSVRSTTVQALDVPNLLCHPVVGASSAVGSLTFLQMDSFYHGWAL